MIDLKPQVMLVVPASLHRPSSSAQQGGPRLYEYGTVLVRVPYDILKVYPRTASNHIILQTFIRIVIGTFISVYQKRISEDQNQNTYSRYYLYQNSLYVCRVTAGSRTPGNVDSQKYSSRISIYTVFLDPLPLQMMRFYICKSLFLPYWVIDVE